MTNPGTVIPLLEQLISYTPFLQPHVLTENNYELTYTYGADYERIKCVLRQNNTLMRTRYYMGAGYEKDIVNRGANRDIHYIDSPAGLTTLLRATALGFHKMIKEKSDFYYWRPRLDYSHSGLPVMGYMFGAVGGLAVGALQTATANKNQWILQKINYRKGNSVPVSWVPSKPN